MYTMTASNENGSCYLDVFIDYTRGEVLFITTIAIPSTDTKPGLYKEYTYKTHRAARNKYEALTKKYNIA